MTLKSQFIPNFYLITNGYIKKIVGSNETEIYQHNQGIQYLPSSECWGLNFVRNKHYEADEKLASYRLELTVILGGLKRSFPNMAAAVTEHILDGGVVNQVHRRTYDQKYNRHETQS